MTEPRQTLLEVLTSDHAAIFDRLDQLDARLAQGEVGGADLGAEGLREQLVIQTVRHLVAEEQYLLPLLRAHLEHGATLAEAGFAANRSIEDTLRGLENPHADPDYLGVTLAGVRRQLRELASEVLGAEQVAPTRPRALAPENPLLNKVSGLVEGLIDQVRDSYTHRGVAADEVE